MIVHERGYYLLNPNQGDIMYRDVVRRMEENLGIEAVHIVEQRHLIGPENLKTFLQGQLGYLGRVKKFKNRYRICQEST